MDVAIIGLGLIGGSLLRALSAAGHRVHGYDADPATREAAGASTTTAEAAKNADLVVLAVPLPATDAVLTELTTIGYDGLVTDVTSVKAPVRDLVGRRLASARFVGGHPMAGKETSGFAAADPHLFEGCAWVLCLEAHTVLADWLELAALYTGLGARVVPATADEHDRAVAAVSHVPHLLASALAARTATDRLAATLGAGSFRDGTRVAASAPRLTAAMCGGNARFVRDELDAVLADLTAARAALDRPDPIAALQPWLTTGWKARRNWPPQPGPATELPAEADELLRLGRAGGWVTAVAQDRRTVTAEVPFQRS